MPFAVGLCNSPVVFSSPPSYHSLGSKLGRRIPLVVGMI